MIEKCPILKRFAFIDNKNKFTRKDVLDLYNFYDEYISKNNIEKKDEKIKEVKVFRKKFNQKPILIMKGIIVIIMIIALAIKEYYPMNYKKISTLTIVVALIVFVIASLIYDVLVMVQYDKYKAKLDKIEELKNNCENLSEKLNELIDSYNNDEQNDRLFLKVLYHYETIKNKVDEIFLFLKITDKELVKTKEEFNNDFKKINIVIQKIDSVKLEDNKNFYLENKEDFYNSIKNCLEITNKTLNDIAQYLNENYLEEDELENEDIVEDIDGLDDFDESEDDYLEEKND
ncbi:MAG: hypothetical protein IJX17_04385 [Clostridia bacterium]|nr:hypothetical protein [Clostridia bacterium]